MGSLNSILNIAVSGLQTALSTAASALNTAYNGQYIFAGDATNTQPFNASSLSDLTATPDVSTTPLSTPLTSAQSTQLQTLETQFNTALTSANAVSTQNGVIQSQVANITSVNLGQVETNITLAQNALQASADVFTTLQSSSLFNLLNSSSS